MPTLLSSVGVGGHAAADPGGHCDRLLYPMDAGDAGKGREGQGQVPDAPCPVGINSHLILSLPGIGAVEVADAAGSGQCFPGGKRHPRVQGGPWGWIADPTEL